MTPNKPTRLIGVRGLAVVGVTALLGAGAAAVPAHAQTDVEPDVMLDFESPIHLGESPQWGYLEITFDRDDDWVGDQPPLTAELAIDAPADTITFQPHDTGPCDDTGRGLLCTEDNGAYGAEFDFDYGPGAAAAPGDYDYQLTVTFDGEIVYVSDGSIEVVDPDAPDPDRPFTHTYEVFAPVAPGDSVEVTPQFRLERELSADAAAVVISFSNPWGLVGIDLYGADAFAGYDNCYDGRFGDDQDLGRGATCIITGFTGEVGGVYTVSEDSPVTYTIAADAAGPQDICHCTYSIRTMSADEFDGPFWDETSDNLLKFETDDQPWNGNVSELDESYRGWLTIPTTDNPYDLAVDDVNIEGATGDEVTATVPVTNHGPAKADARSSVYGTYIVAAQLPAGVDLVAIDSDGGEDWICLDQESLPAELERASNLDLESLDFYCFIDDMDAGETVDFTFTVRITDSSSAADGTIVVDAVSHAQGHLDSLDADLANNSALVGVNAADLIGGGSGKLPVTGTSLSIIVAVATAILGAGAVALVMSRRRRAAASW